MVRTAVNQRGPGRPPLDPEGILDEVVRLLAHPRRRVAERQRRELVYAAFAWVILDDVSAAAREAGGDDTLYTSFLGDGGSWQPSIQVLAELGRLRDPQRIRAAAEVLERKEPGLFGARVLAQHMALTVRAMRWDDPPAPPSATLSDMLGPALASFWTRHTPRAGRTPCPEAARSWLLDGLVGAVQRHRRRWPELSDDDVLDALAEAGDYVRAGRC